MKNEGVILDHLRSAIACVYGGLVDQALHHVDAVRFELTAGNRSAAARPGKLNPEFAGPDARVMHGLNELRDARPTRVIEWDVTDVDAEIGGEG